MPPDPRRAPPRGPADADPDAARRAAADDAGADAFPRADTDTDTDTHAGKARRAAADADSDADTADAPRTAADAEVAELLPRVYEELRAVAERHLRRERAGHTLQPTALVHEAYLRLAELDRIRWRDETHFLVAASGAIRRVLVDHARTRGAAKRGGGLARVTLSGVDSAADGPDVDLLALDEALERLAARNARKARVVELRYFGGLTLAETAAALDVGTTTVEDDWAFARSWLRRELGTV